MTPIEYQILAMKTAKDMGSTKMNLIHGAMGVSSDAGELVDAIKKHTIYNKELDFDNVVEEIGDVLWFCALICNTVGTNLSVVMEANISKLAKRYPDKYTDEAAIARADKTINQLGIRCYRIASTLEAGIAHNFIPEEYQTVELAEAEAVESDSIWIEYLDDTVELMP